MNDASMTAWLVDLVIVVTLIEGGGLLLYRQATGKGVNVRDFVLNMVAGLCLMLALRAAVHDAGVAWIAVCLLAAGLAHGADLWLRWRREEVSVAHGRELLQ